jgi:hypothetical protein
MTLVLPGLEIGALFMGLKVRSSLSTILGLALVDSAGVVTVLGPNQAVTWSVDNTDLASIDPQDALGHQAVLTPKMSVGLVVVTAEVAADPDDAESVAFSVTAEVTLAGGTAVAAGAEIVITGTQPLPTPTTGDTGSGTGTTGDTGSTDTTGTTGDTGTGDTQPAP